MTTKTFSRFEIKDADQGVVEAVFSTFGVVDADGDVTDPAAFDPGAEMPISAYNHGSWTGALPVGKGRIRTNGSEAILDGQFFLDTSHGRDAFLTIKNLGPLGQWSYGYDPVKFAYGEHDGRQVRFLQKLKVHEVSPVLIGAGVGTRTVAAKTGQAATFHDEATAVLAAVTALVDRAADVMAKRQEKGKQLGTASTGLISQIEAQLKRLSELLTSTPDGEPDLGELQAQYLKFVALTRSVT